MKRCNLCLQQIERVFDSLCAQCYWSKVSTPININYNMYIVDKWDQNDILRVHKDYKLCTYCNEIFPKTLEYFYKNGKSLNSKCIPCYKEYRKQ